MLGGANRDSKQTKMTMCRTMGIKRGGVAAAALALLLVPGLARSAQTQPLHRKHAAHLAVRPAQLVSSGIGSFTPAAADAHFGSSFGRGGLGSSGVRFTPSLTPGGPRHVTVAVRARASTPEQAERSAFAGSTAGLTPYAYNLGVAVGWKRFAVSSDYSKVDLGLEPGSREAADVAVSFAGHRWSTRLALAADRSIGSAAQYINSDRGVALDLGGSYSISSRLDVTGGVRYRSEKDQLLQLSDDRRDSQAVYVGTAFRF
jgi:hypothetical protein